MVNYGGSSTLKPYQFAPETYGAKGDGQVATDVVTNSTSVITSATIAADTSAVGKWVMVNGGNGNPGIPVLGKITAVSGSSVTLNVSAGASVSNCQAVWGTDDTAAINAAITAAQTYALAGSYLAQVVFGAKIYVTATLTQASSPAVYNTQILVPYPAQNGQTRKLMVSLIGAGYSAPCQYWESVAPNMQGAVIVSMLTAPSTQDPAFLQQSVIGGPSGTAGFTGLFANTHLTIENLSVWCPAYTNIKALDMGVLSGCHLDGYASQIFAPANNVSGAAAAHPYLADFPAQALFQNSHGVGILFPASGNNDAVDFGSIAVEGYEVGILGQDHLTGHRYAGLYCDVILKITPAASHEVSIVSVSAEQYNGGILVSGGSNVRLDIGWDGEVTSPVYDVSDAGNVATGEVRWYDLNHSVPAVTGAGALRVINQRLGPGHWGSPPAVPASGSAVAAANLPYRDAWVSVHAGAGVTVSVITVDGTATGLTVAAAASAAVWVPAGKTIALTYAGGTPTWDWWLA